MIARRAICRSAVSLSLLLALSVAPSAIGSAQEQVVASSASDEAVLATVDPELRSPVRFLLHAPAPSVGKAPPRAIPLPDGVTERLVPGGVGQPPVPVYIVNAGRPDATPRGAILFLHGGGFIMGDARQNLRSLIGLAERLDCVIVSVQYRLAPATRFPGPVEDAYAGLKWLHDSAPELGVDKRRIALLGESAGGGLAAMLAIMARDRGEVPVAFQALTYPMLDDRTGSSRPVPPHIGRIVWTAASNRMGWAALLGQKAGERVVPAGSVPAREADLTRLPRTFIGVGSIDLFVEEDIDYARRLIHAGVPTELLVLPGAYHGFELIAPRAAVSRAYRTALEAALGRALQPQGK